MMLKNKKILITGGAGFIGTNFTKYFCKNNKVVVVDNLSRKGSENNLNSLISNCNIEFINADITSPDIINTLRENHPDIEIIIHLASQVAVTTSIQNPMKDFFENAAGTFYMLEYARSLSHKPIFLFSSTNKVYGSLNHIEILEKSNKYEFKNKKEGIDESVNLDFHSPYGCSKGCADQYVKDYFRIYNIPTVVFRQSCIYGEHQLGVEDQGWVAWFLIAMILKKKITIYGNGKQVRDILHISDLISAYEKTILNIDRVKGKVFNIGGGMGNALSLLEYMDILKNDLNLESPLSYDKTRSGDQKIFISDSSKIMRELNWKPEVTIQKGLSGLYQWLSRNIEAVKILFA